MWKVPLSDIDFGREEIQAVSNVLRSGWLTQGPVTRRFEEEFADYLGVKHAIAVSSGTASLHLALAALGITMGDEVIVPSLSFVATAAAVTFVGAIPVYADIIHDRDLTICPRSIESKITQRTKAVIVMHYGGYTCEMRSISKLAAKHGFAIIEDAAHAPGAAHGALKLGTIGEIGCFSFYSNKNLVTGEGGMVTTDRDKLAEKIQLMRSHGITSDTWRRHLGVDLSYDVVNTGYNYRIDEVRSALGLVQLKKLEENNSRRREITVLYRKKLSGLAGISIPFLDHPEVSSAHLFPILLREGWERRTFMDEMRSRKIQTSIHYPPIHQMSFNLNGEALVVHNLPMTESVGQREVTLPLYPGLKAADLDTVVDAVKIALIKSAQPI